MNHRFAEQALGFYSTQAAASLLKGSWESAPVPPSAAPGAPRAQQWQCQHSPLSSPGHPSLLQAGPWIQGLWSFGFPANAKKASSKASRQAPAPGKGAPKEELSAAHAFHFLYNNLRISHSSGDIPSLKPPSSLSSQDCRLPQPLTLQMIDHKFPISLLREENQARPKPLYMHTTPPSPQHPPDWLLPKVICFGVWVFFPAIAPPETSCPSQVLAHF